jgi:hypothetical protein
LLSRLAAISEALNSSTDFEDPSNFLIFSFCCNCPFQNTTAISEALIVQQFLHRNQQIPKLLQPTPPHLETCPLCSEALDHSRDFGPNAETELL